MLESSIVAKGRSLATISVRGNKLHVNYRINGDRVRRATGLDDTKENRAKLEKDIIPALIIKIKLGDLKRPSQNTFSYYFDKFLIMHQEDKSYHNQVYIYQKVNAKFGTKDVARITRLHIKEFLASMDIKDKSKKDYLLCIRGVFDIALDDEVINTNIAREITFKRAEKEPIEIFSSKEVDLLLSSADPMMRNYLAIGFYTGMRSGEILGLMRKDIKDDRIEIRRSISKGRITSPKTIGSIRDIPMFNSVRPFIEDQINRSESLYLFDYNKSFLNDVSFFKKRWHKLISSCDIYYRKLYSTRHTFITTMLNSGKFKIMEIAAIVGHTSPQMIMQNYTGFIKDSHLKIDTDFELFGHSLDTVIKKEKLEKA